MGGGELALGLVFAEFLIEENVIESSVCRIGGAGAVVDGIDPRPVGRRQAHGARLATGIELAAGQGEGSQGFRRRADGVDLAVGRGIVGRGHGVDSLAQNPSITHDQGGKWSARAADNVVRGQRDGAAQELRIGICRHLVIDPTD